MFLHQIWPICIIVILCITGLASVAVADSKLQSETVAESAGDRLEKSREQIEQIVQHRLANYATLYPEIDFVLLDTTGDVAGNMRILAKILGEDPDPLDYEHPEHLRHELLMATLMRIELLLQTDVGSSTLFKPGKGAVARRKQVCVITMAPWQIAADDRAATRHLLELTDREFAAISPLHYLDHVAHLEFALDHEIFHCLDTIYNGPVSMSRLKYWGDYHMLKEESAADAFGLIMHLAAHRSLTPYAQTLRRIRGLTLLAGDTNHFTYRSLSLVLHLDPVALADEDIQARFRHASQISTRTVGSYTNYLRYAQAACYAMKQLGKACSEKKFRQQAVDHTLARTLINDTRMSYRAIIGRELPGGPH